MKIQPVIPCNNIGKCQSSPSGYASYIKCYSGTPSPAAVAAHAMRELEAARARDVAVHEQNLLAFEANKAIALRIEELMAEIGMPKSWSERDTKSHSRYIKTITHTAGWIGDVGRNCVVNDGFEHATTLYERLLKEYQAYAERATKEMADAAAKAQRVRDAELAKRRADIELASMLLRYGLPIESEWSDVLDLLRAKHQRLDLAVAMQLTRGDWSEGPYRVKDALDRFQIENTEDKDIANDVLSCLEDFSDGRVFRDTTWSYDRLFASVEDEVLRADCQKAMGMAGDA